MTEQTNEYKHLRSITANDLPHGLFIAVGSDDVDMFQEVDNDLHELGGCIWKDVEDRVAFARLGLQPLDCPAGRFQILGGKHDPKRTRARNCLDTRQAQGDG